MARNAEFLLQVCTISSMASASADLLLLAQQGQPVESLFRLDIKNALAWLADGAAVIWVTGSTR